MSLFNKQIPLMKPWLTEEEWLSLKDVILSGWISMGPKVKEFEDLVANYIGVKYAVATNSCTSALHLALRIQGVKQGDEVIMTNLTCMAGANAVIMAGAHPVFVDIDADTYNINPDLIEDAISERTTAILNTDQIGLASDLDRIKKIAAKHKLILVDDAATALGGTYKNKYLGSQGIVTCFSFHPRKMITTGEGGMLVTEDENIAEKAIVLRSSGASISDLKRHEAKGVLLQKYFENGYNYRMTDLQASIGIIQMKKIHKIIEERTKQANFYNEAFKNSEFLKTPYVPDYAKHCYSSYMLKLKTKIDISELVSHMAKHNISCRYGIMPLHKEPFFSGQYNDKMFPVSCDVSKKTFFIPIFPGLSKNELSSIVETLNRIIIKIHVKR